MITVVVNPDGVVQVNLPADGARESRALILKLTTEEGALLRILVDSQGRYALGLRNIDTGEYQAVALIGTGDNQTFALVNLP